MKFVQVSTEGAIGTLAFDHYAKRNALGAASIGEMLAAFDEFKKAGVRVVILRAAGTGKVWSAGHDIDELPKADIDPLPYNDPLEQLLRGVKAFPSPVIGMVHGSVWGGACDLVMACDIVIGDPTATFAITPAKLGLPYNIAGLLNFMSRLPLAIVKEMFFTADPIPAERAVQVGIMNHLVPEAELEARTLALAKSIASRSPMAISAMKEALHALAEALPLSPQTFEYLHGLRREVYFGRDYHEGVQAFVEKRSARF